MCSRYYSIVSMSMINGWSYLSHFINSIHFAHTNLLPVVSAGPVRGAARGAPHTRRCHCASAAAARGAAAAAACARAEPRRSSSHWKLTSIIGYCDEIKVDIIQGGSVSTTLNKTTAITTLWKPNTIYLFFFPKMKVIFSNNNNKIIVVI